MDASRPASDMPSPMNCCASQSSEDSSDSGLAVPPTLATSAKKSLTKLIAALDTPRPLGDHSYLLKLARDACEVVQTCMQPLPPCQEAVLQIREMIQELMSRKQAEWETAFPPENHGNRRAPVMSLEIADADWEYLPNTALELKNKIEQVGPPGAVFLLLERQSLKLGTHSSLKYPQRPTAKFSERA